MTITYHKTFQGAWELSTIAHGRRFAHQYMGYTKREATAEFRMFVKYSLVCR